MIVWVSEMLQRTSRKRLERGDYKYVALKSSRPFHALSCPMMAGIAEKGRIYFRDHEEAIASGKKPCIVCVQWELNR